MKGGFRWRDTDYDIGQFSLSATPSSLKELPALVNEEIKKSAARLFSQSLSDVDRWLKLASDGVLSGVENAEVILRDVFKRTDTEIIDALQTTFHSTGDDLARRLQNIGLAPCGRCHTTGVVPETPCTNCDPNGQIEGRAPCGVCALSGHCLVCRGAGKISVTKPACSICGGAGVVNCPACNGAGKICHTERVPDPRKPWKKIEVEICVPCPSHLPCQGLPPHEATTGSAPCGGPQCRGGQCTACNGAGSIPIRVPCPACGGRKMLPIPRKCPDCQGKKVRLLASV